MSGAPPDVDAISGGSRAYHGPYMNVSWAVVGEDDGATDTALRCTLTRSPSSLTMSSEHAEPTAWSPDSSLSWFTSWFTSWFAPRSPSESRSVPVYRRALFQSLVKAYQEDRNFHRNLGARAELGHPLSRRPDDRTPLKVEPNEEPSEITLTFPLSLVKVGATVQQSVNDIVEGEAERRRDPSQISALSAVLESCAMQYLSRYTAEDVEKMGFSDDDLRFRFELACGEMMTAVRNSIDSSGGALPDSNACDVTTVTLDDRVWDPAQSLNAENYNDYRERHENKNSPLNSVLSWVPVPGRHPELPTHIVIRTIPRSQVFTCTPTYLARDRIVNPDLPAKDKVSSAPDE